MRNFFEGVPASLYEAAEIDGCSPMGIFIKIVLPLSKAALASIGLMFAVAVWNDYSTVQIYITDDTQYNFQYKLRNMILDGDTPTTSYNISQTTLYNAGIVVAILPFMILYPFLQKYFVTGVNIGAVKE
jgi:putative aldouronate transport system permease protein